MRLGWRNSIRNQNHLTDRDPNLYFVGGAESHPAMGHLRPFHDRHSGFLGPAARTVGLLCSGAGARLLAPYLCGLGRLDRRDLPFAAPDFEHVYVKNIVYHQHGFVVVFAGSRHGRSRQTPASVQLANPILWHVRPNRLKAGCHDNPQGHKARCLVSHDAAGAARLRCGLRTH